MTWFLSYKREQASIEFADEAFMYEINVFKKYDGFQNWNKKK